MIELALHTTRKPGVYRVEWNGMPIVTSRQPFYDAARVLLRHDVESGTELQARWKGSEIIAMRSTVGEAAKWTVEERDRGGIRRALWKPHSSYAMAPENALEASGRENGASDPERAFLSVPGGASVDRHGTLSRPVDNLVISGRE